MVVRIFFLIAMLRYGVIVVGFICVLNLMPACRGALLWPCTVLEDCEDFQGSFCKDNVCACAEDEVFSADMTKCIKVATGYGQPCNETLQCSNWLLVGAKCTEAGFCECSSGFHYRHGRCFATRILGESCVKDENCYDGFDIEALSCKAGTCQCSDNYNYRVKTDCRRKATHVGDACVVASDCLFEDAVCDENFQCQSLGTKLMVASSPVLKRKARAYANSVFGKKCSKSEECSAKLPNSFCFATCQCSRAHVYDVTTDACLPELGEPSSKKGSCEQYKNSVFRDGQCLCKIGYAYSKDNHQCHKPTRALNFSCTSDLNCYTMGPASICKDHGCICGLNSWYDEANFICRTAKGITEDCESDVDCQVDSSVSAISPQCLSGKCSCPSGSHSINNKACFLDAPDLGEACSEQSKCLAENSECVNGKCLCDPTHVQVGSLCKQGIGTPCENDVDCPIFFSRCTKRLCQCQNGYVNVAHVCYELSQNINDSCELDIQCQIQLNNGSYCANDQCICKEGNHLRNGKCWPRVDLNNICKHDGECFVESETQSVECRNGICQCAVGFRKSVDLPACVRGDGFIARISWMAILFCVGFKILN